MAVCEVVLKMVGFWKILAPLESFWTSSAERDSVAEPDIFNPNSQGSGKGFFAHFSLPLKEVVLGPLHCDFHGMAFLPRVL